MGEPSADDIMREVLRLQDQITETRGEAMRAENVRQAVADGIRLAVADPDMWSDALAAMQKHAQKEAGGWLLGWIKGMLSKAALFAMIGLGVYALGGWSALLALLKSGASHS